MKQHKYSIGALAVVGIAGALWISSTYLGHLENMFAGAAVSMNDIPDLYAQAQPMFEYVEINGSCGPHFEGECVQVRSGPSTDFSVVTSVRNGVVLRAVPEMQADGHLWYKIIFEEFLRYPERVFPKWYVAGEYARSFKDPGPSELAPGATASSTKRIVVSRGEQMLYAYEGDVLFMQESISTGILTTPTPRGTFTIYRKTPSRYMQGPLPGISDKFYDLPGVPWNLYFTHEGAVIHGAYWHESFGSVYSNGCVNLPLLSARKLYEWAELGTPVIVQD